MASAEKILKVIFAADASAVDKAFGSIESHSSSVRQKIGAIGKSMVSAGSAMTTHLTLPIVAGLGVATAMAEKNAASNRLLERSLQSAGIKGGAALANLGDFSAKLGEQIGVSEIDLKTLEGRVVSMGHSFFAAVGPNAAQKDVRGLTLGMENLAASSGKSINMLMRSLGPSILNAPDKAAASLAKFGVLTQKQADHIKAMTKAGHAQAATQLELNALMGANAGAAAKAATPMAKLRSTLEHVGIVIGTIVMPYVERFAAFVGRLAERFQHLSPHIQKIIVIAGVLLAALGPVLMIVGSIAGGLMALTLPVLAVIAGLVALGVAAYYVVKHWQTVKATTLNVWHAVQHAVLTVVNAISKAVHSTVGKVIVGVFKTAWGVIKTVTMVAWSLIQLAVIRPVQALWKTISPILHIFARNWHQIWNGIKDAFSAVWGVLIAVARPVLNVLIDLLNALLHGINAVIHGFNLIPGHSEVPTIPTIPHLARGTADFIGGLAVVGERGQELVDLPRHSAVYPHGMGAGNSTTINVHVDVAGSVTADRDLAETIRRQLLLIARRNGGKVGLS